MDQTRGKQITSARRTDGYALLILLACIVVLFAGYLFTWPTPLIFPKADLGTDLPREIWPLIRFEVDSIRQTGAISLWRPYMLSGAPVVGHPVAPLFYPPHWIALIMPIPLALNLSAVLHLWWAGAGTYIYLRRRVRWQAALIGGLVFALSPKWIAHLSGGHWPMLAAIAWWPWVWLAFNQYWASGKKKWVALLGVALAAQALNHGSYLVMSLLWLGAYSLALARRANIGRWLRRMVFGWGMAGLIAAGLACVQLLPLAELLPYVNRATLTAQEAAGGSVPPTLLLSALVPPKLRYPEFYLYPGVVVLLLVGLGWAAGWSRREKWWGVSILAGLVMSLGPSTPLYVLLRWVPAGVMRVPARWWMFSLYGMAALAAWGVEKWLDGTAATRRRVRVTLAGFAVLYPLAAGLNVVLAGAIPFYTGAPALVVVIVAALVALRPARWRVALLAVVVVAETAWISRELIRPEPETNLTSPDPIAAFLQVEARSGVRSLAPYERLPEAALVTYDLRAAGGYDSFLLAAYADLVDRASGCSFAGFAVSAPSTQTNPQALEACPNFDPDLDLLRLLNVRYVILDTPDALNGVPVAMEDGGRWVYDLGAGLGAAFGVAQAETMNTCPDHLNNLDPAAVALVEAPMPTVEGASPPEVLARAGSGDRATFTVRATEPGLLVRAEAWAPGWKAVVDEETAEVLRVNCALQGVWLEAGEHHVAFTYEPQGFIIGRWISLFTLLVLFGWIFGAITRQVVRRLRSGAGG